MTRIAHCCCGSLRAEATGEPAFVAACHCMECQRRTGSPFGVSAYFPKEQVCTEGPSKVYLRGSDSGRKIKIHFCPDCGSSVFWYAEVVPDLMGVAFGTFADPSMPRPMRRDRWMPAWSLAFSLRFHPAGRCKPPTAMRLHATSSRRSPT